MVSGRMVESVIKPPVAIQTECTANLRLMIKGNYRRKK
jgi:hypothetical protein